MPQQKGAVGQDVINVTVSVGVHHMTSFTPDQERRNAADTAERTDGAVDAAGHDFFRCREQCFGLGDFHDKPPKTVSCPHAAIWLRRGRNR